MTKTVQVVELRQARCSNRFGVSPCVASGTPKCFQTYNTCLDKANFNKSGQLSWYFHRQGDPVPSTAALPDPNFVYPPSIPILQTVRTSPTRLNIGGVRENESPFGKRGTITVDLSDFEFRNQFGDFYANERVVKGSLGRLLLAWLGEAIPQLEMYLYSGSSADASLADMTIRRYNVTNITPPVNGIWTVSGVDPLDLAGRKKAQFPRSTDLLLQTAINETDTTISVSGLERDVSDSFGNDGFFYGRLGSEIIRYTGYSGADGIWALTGVSRGVLNTTATSHEVDAGMQRVGHYNKILYWQLVYDLLSKHTTIPASLIPYNDEWTEEGISWLSTLSGTGTFTSPRPVDELSAEAMRDGMFSIWWDERQQKIKLLANRQPDAVAATYTERNAIVKSELKRTPEDRRTRVTIYYNRQNPVESLTQESNYATQRIRIDGEAESVNFADGTVRNLIWYSPLMRTDLNAVLVQSSFLQRYNVTPRYLDVEIAEKDSTISVGNVVQVTTHDELDSLGNPKTEAWQVIEWEELEPGFSYRIMLQSFVLYERPGFIMDNSSPDFAVATEEQKENACYISNDDETMPDGTAAYVIQ